MPASSNSTSNLFGKILKLAMICVAAVVLIYAMVLLFIAFLAGEFFSIIKDAALVVDPETLQLLSQLA